VESADTTRAEAGLLASLKFCERCKASIPESEFRDGHALHMGKRHVHVDCLLKRGAALPLLALVLGLAGTALGVYALVAPKGSTSAPAGSSAAEVSQQVRTATEAATARIQTDLATLRKEVADVANTRAEIAALDERLRSGREGLEKKGQDAAAALDALSARLGRIEEGVTGVATKAEGLMSLDGKFNALSQAVADLRKDVNKLKAGGEATPPDGGTPPR
jgi:hypothetical protein